MKLKSQAQRAYFPLHTPALASTWERHTSQGKTLPRHVQKSALDTAHAPSPTPGWDPALTLFRPVPGLAPPAPDPRPAPPPPVLGPPPPGPAYGPAPLPMTPEAAAPAVVLDQFEAAHAEQSLGVADLPMLPARAYGPQAGGPGGPPAIPAPLTASPGRTAPPTTSLAPLPQNRLLAHAGSIGAGGARRPADPARGMVPGFRNPMPGAPNPLGAGTLAYGEMRVPGMGKQGAGGLGSASS